MAEAEEGVPENVGALLEEGIHVPEQETPEAMVLYQRMLEGKCILCESECGESTCVIFNQLGVVMVFCRQVCLQDFFNMNWMMEQYDDFVEAAKFRNQKGNN